MRRGAWPKVAWNGFIAALHPHLLTVRHKWAIFVDGCSWDRHPGCRLATTSTRNREFWIAKFERNAEQDARVVTELEHLGYAVLVLWEC